MARQNNVQRFCWEQVLRTNRLFRVSHLFCPAPLADQLLALHALFASIELASCEVTDETVALRKINWWRGELSNRQAAQSSHPVISHLNASGALEKLPAVALRALLSNADARIDASAPTDEDEFLLLCQGVYRPQVQLELAVGGIDVAFDDAKMVSGGLIQLLRESNKRKENALWWVPLNLLARFGIKRSDLEAFQDSDALRALFTHLLGLVATPVEDRLFFGQADRLNRAGDVHLQLMIALHNRQLARLQVISPAMYSAELARWRAADLMDAWKRARQLNTRSESELDIADE
jgi:phytoene synthase